MKTLFYSLIFLIIPFYTFGQTLIKYTGFGGPGDNRVYKSIIDNNNNIYTIGFFTGTVNAGGNFTAYGTGQDVYVSKYDPNGNLIWFKQIGSNNQDDYIDALTLANNGNTLLIVGGYNGATCDFGNGFTLNNSSPGTSDAFMASLNTSDGSVNSVMNLAYGSGTQRPQDISIDKNLNIIVIGFVQGNSYTTYFTPTNSIVCNGVQNYFILQLSSSLNFNWVKQFAGNDLNNKLFALDVDNNGYYIAGTNKNILNLDITTLNSQGGTADMFLYKTDFNGNGQWVRSIKGSGADVSVYSTCDQLGNIYISGYYASADLKVDSTATLQSTRSIPNKGGNDIFFAKYTTDGALQWFDVAGSTGDDRLTRLNTNGQYIAIAGQYGGPMTFGQQTITPQGGIDAFGVVHDANDNPLYAISAGGSGSDVYQTCLLDNTGNYIFIGQGYSPTTYFSPTSYLTNPTPSTRDVFIAKYNKASISIVKSDISCTGSADGEADAVPRGALVTPLTYLWTKKGDPAFSQNTAGITGLGPGRYYIKVTDAINYQLIDSVDFTDPAPVSVALTSSSNVKCFNGANGAIDITPSGGTTPYTYAWTTVGGSGVNATAQDQTTLTVGTYNVSVTDANGCSATLTNIALTQPAKVMYKGTVVTKINGSTGSVTLAVQGGTPNYTFQWTGPSFTATTQNISGLTNAGNYLVNVTDANSCQSDTTVFVADSHVMNAYIGSKQDVLCYGQSTGSASIVVENAVAPITYNWGGGRTQATETGLAAGTYTITVTDATPTTTTVILKISQPSSTLSVSLAKTNISCYNANNGVLDANPTGGTLPYVYNWTKDGQPFDGGNETQINLAEGTYWVTATDANNCTASTSAVITNPSQISVNGAVITPVTCTGAKNDGAISLNVSGGTGTLGYRWSNGLTTQNISLLSAGTYRCTITDASNCKTTTQQTVGQPAPITASFSNTNVSCFGGSNGAIDLTPSGGNAGGYTFAWSNAATTEDISGLTMGTYNVTITDSKNCKNTLTTTLSQPPYLILGASSILNVNCFGAANGSITASTAGGTSPYVYQWSNGQFGSVATNLAPGTYSVTVTDGHNCQKSITYPDITEPSALTIAEVMGSHVDEVCNGGSAGALEVTSTGGSGSYEYSLDGLAWQTGSLFTSIPANAYNVKVRDQNVPSCIKTISPAITISQPTVITFSSQLKKDISCNGLTNGEIDAIAAGGTGTLAYTLKLNGTATGNTSGAANGQFTGLAAAGNYTVEVTDANNCGPVISNALSIEEPQSLSFTSAVKKDITCFGLTNGEIDAAAAGGTGALAYTLKLNGTATGNTSGAASGQFTGLAKGTNYTVEVSDANSCGPATSSALDIAEPAAIAITNEAFTKPTHAGLSDATLTITANGGTGTLQFSLNSGSYQNTGAFIGLPQGTYTVRVTDANNCGPVNSNTIQITDPTGIDLLKGGYLKVYPNPAIETAYLEINGGTFEAITLEIQNISGKTVKTFKWTDVTSTFKEALDLSSLPKGVYLVRINNTVIKDKLVIQ